MATLVLLATEHKRADLRSVLATRLDETTASKRLERCTDTTQCVNKGGRLQHVLRLERQVDAVLVFMTCFFIFCCSVRGWEDQGARLATLRRTFAIPRQAHLKVLLKRGSRPS
jgi:hypothetical protein